MFQFSKLMSTDIHKCLSICNFSSIGLLSEKECFIEKCKGFTVEEISLKHSVSTYKVEKILGSVKKKIIKSFQKLDFVIIIFSYFVN